MRSESRWAKVENEHKHCFKCGRMRPFSQFYRCHRGRAGLATRCKSCQRNSDSGAGLARSRKYYALRPSRKIYQGLTRRRFTVMPFADFEHWYLSQVRECAYCGISEELAISLFKHRLSVDRMDSSLGYEAGNVTLACQRCNLIKSGYLTYEEMKDVAAMYVRPKVEAALKSAGAL